MCALSPKKLSVRRLCLWLGLQPVSPFTVQKPSKAKTHFPASLFSGFPCPALEEVIT